MALKFILLDIFGPPPFEFSQKVEGVAGSDFSPKRGGVGKIGGLKKNGVFYQLFSYQTLSSLIFIWVSGSVCFAYLQHICQYFLFTNQQLCDFNKSVIFEKEKYLGTQQNFFLILVNLFNIIQKGAMRTTDSVNIYLFGCLLCAFVCVLGGWVFMCVISNRSTSTNPRHGLDLDKLALGCIKHKTRSLWYKGTKAWHM